ncbi:MAG: acetylornithine aminotransferase [Candidatus Firestonebacteria bacterium RifOxyC12_full_39_7]|nr:MAG: acetylornithine aminotransferase [Candidatus Firestonebacteria bacterium RifOxyC12_full_39_7]
MKNEQIMAEEKACIFPTYSSFPFVITKGKGMKVIDNNGKEYLDFLGGIAVDVLGHCHPKVTSAVRNQVNKLVHVSNLYYTIPQIKLAKLICRLSGLNKCFFANSGAEANEAAIKLARKYAKEKLGAGKYEIITMKGSFHGRTMATLSATGQEKIQKGFEPLLEGFKYAEYGDFDSLKNLVSEQTCAVLLEPIQGEGGVKVPSVEYLKKVRELCDEKNIVLILDEIQSGIGRTGNFFAYEGFGIRPDIVTLAKGIGGGLPLGIMVANDKVASGFSAGSHGSTFGGGPVVCVAGLAVLETIIKDKLIKNASETGAYFIEKLKELVVKYSSIVKEARGMGLMIGLELTVQGKELVVKMAEKGFLINCTAEKVLRFLPPLIVTRRQIDRLVSALDEVLSSTRF